MGHLSTRCTRPWQHTNSRLEQPTLAESFNQCVLYEKKGSRWTAVTDGVTLHMAKDMVPVYTVEKPEVHPHAENFQPQVCAMKQQWGLSQARGRRQACVPGQKCVK